MARTLNPESTSTINFPIQAYILPFSHHHAMPLRSTITCVNLVSYGKWDRSYTSGSLYSQALIFLLSLYCDLTLLIGPQCTVLLCLSLAHNNVKHGNIVKTSLFTEAISTFILLYLPIL